MSGIKSRAGKGRLSKSSINTRAGLCVIESPFLNERPLICSSSTDPSFNNDLANSSSEYSPSPLIAKSMCFDDNTPEGSIVE